MPSNRLTWVSITPCGRVWLSTVKPWFIEVISTLPVSRSFTGWFAPWWPWFILTVLAPQRQRQHLVAQANAEQRQVRGQHALDHRHGIDAGRRRIAGAVRQEHAFGLLRQHVFGGGGGGQDGHFAARRGQAAQDVALGAVVDRHDAQAGALVAAA